MTDGTQNTMAAGTGTGTSAGVGRAARPRTTTLLDAEQRAAFLSEWEAVQAGFVSDPEHAAQAAEQLVTDLANGLVRRIGEIIDTAVRPKDAGPGGADGGETEEDRSRLLRCREAFHSLIDI